MSEFICPVLISRDLAGLFSFYWLLAVTVRFREKERGAWRHVSSGRYSKAMRWEGSRAFGCKLYANINLDLKGGAQRAGERGLLVRNKDAVLFSFGLHSEERKDA